RADRQIVLPTDTTTPTPSWCADINAKAQVLSRYVDDPRPLTQSEILRHVRPVQLVQLNCEDTVGALQCDEDELLEHFDPMLRPENQLSDDDDERAVTQMYVDFDIIDAAGTEHQLRMQYNDGNADTGLGWCATVRTRSHDERLVGVASSINDSDTIVTCLDYEMMSSWVPHDHLPPTSILLPRIGDTSVAPFAQHVAYQEQPDSFDNVYDTRTYTPRPDLVPFVPHMRYVRDMFLSHAHQVKVLFTVAAKLRTSSFEMVEGIPIVVRTDFARERLVASPDGAAMSLDELTRRAEKEPAVVYWPHVGEEEPKDSRDRRDAFLARTTAETIAEIRAPSVNVAPDTSLGSGAATNAGGDPNPLVATVPFSLGE
ncbi:hypothetical protein HKX48_007439, partial [Thoreauomyces humboldtii]